jgi:hypothetical protein
VPLSFFCASTLAVNSPNPLPGPQCPFRGIGRILGPRYHLPMSRFLFLAFGLPTLITTLCAAFIVFAGHCEQTVYLQLTALIARVVIIASFAFVARQSHRVRTWSSR